ncbi:MAG TPA: NAD(P)H-dependent oxidoreductase [Solimonas sp.]|nr:NAD(P)H-dependent oxidoreductase [Solimonas sp.]
MLGLDRSDHLPGLPATLPMKHLLLIYHSQSGHTAALAQAVQAGAAEFADEVELRVRQAFDAGLDDLLWANGLLIGTPENFGYLSGAVKDFLDRTYYPAEGKTVGLPWAMFVAAGNDGSGAVRALERIATGYGWNRVAEALIVRGEASEAQLAAARELGQTLAAGLACGIF